MSTYAADLTPDVVQAQQLARGMNFAPKPRLKVDQYTQPDATRTFHLVDKHTKSSLWVHIDPAEFPS